MADQPKTKTSFNVNQTRFGKFKMLCEINGTDVTKAFDLFLEGMTADVNPLPFPRPDNPFYKRDSTREDSDLSHVSFSISVPAYDAARLGVLAKNVSVRPEEYIESLVADLANGPPIVPEVQEERDLLRKVMEIYRSGLTGTRKALVLLVDELHEHVKVFGGNRKNKNKT